MNINTGETIDEFGAVERWENEGGSISYTQFGVSAGVIKEAEREVRAAPGSRFILNEAAGSYSRINRASRYMRLGKGRRQ